VVKVMEQMFGPDGGMGDLAELSDKSGEDDKVMQLVDRYGPKVLDLLRKAEGARDEFIRRLRSFLPG
jgi:hypothetical protein